MKRAAWLAAGAAPAFWGVYTWGSHLLTLASVWSGSQERRAIALTFDDGPDRECTPRVLDILEREGVQGAFFLIGRRAAHAPAVARRIVDGGHDLGNHTWSHRSLWRCGPAHTEREIQDGHTAIADAAGEPPRFFRPPWGKTNLAMFGALRRLGTPCVFWTVQPESRRPVAPAEQARRGVARARPGAIYDLHDADGVSGAGARLVAYLPALIAGLREQGYALVPLRELL
ncbi:MAG TPA: polysaccharide deacetylase family protein [Candidatus Eisenbacteria bacterium]|nr:polysaccharide deacetylase family protein [Candidatus Eisenbacteria bacterium]